MAIYSTCPIGLRAALAALEGFCRVEEVCELYHITMTIWLAKQGAMSRII